MNLNHLKFAVEVATSGSFTGAAKACCVSQPTLSNGIQHLERELGGKLFERTTRRVTLTPFGTHMLPSIQAMLNARRELADSATRYFEPQHKLLAIGFSPLVDMRLISALVGPFAIRHEEVTTYFKECFMDGLVDRLEDGQIGLAIRPLLPEQEGSRITLGTQPFYREPVFVVPRDGAPSVISGAGPVTVDELVDETFVLTPNTCGHANATRGWFRERGKTLKEYVGQAISYQVMQDWAALGLASAILPWSKISEVNRGTARALMIDRDTPAHIAFELVWNAGIRSTNPVASFLEHCSARLTSLMQGLHVPGERFTQ